MHYVKKKLLINQLEPFMITSFTLDLSYYLLDHIVCAPAADPLLMPPLVTSSLTASGGSTWAAKALQDTLVCRVTLDSCSTLLVLSGKAKLLVHGLLVKQIDVLLWENFVSIEKIRSRW